MKERMEVELNQHLDTREFTIKQKDAELTAFQVLPRVHCTVLHSAWRAKQVKIMKKSAQIN